MTEYIKNQLIKLCDHPEGFNDMLISLDNNPEEPHTAIRNYLSHVQLNRLLENTKIVHVSFNGDEPKPGFYFEYVHLESQEIKFIQTTTAIKDI